MEQAVIAAVREATAPPDKLELVPLVTAHLGQSVTAKEINKVLYALAGRGVVQHGSEMHGEKPTWVMMASAAGTAAADSDEEENKPLQPRAKSKAKAKVAEEPAASSAPEAEPQDARSEAASSSSAPAPAAAAAPAAAPTSMSVDSDEEEDKPLSKPRSEAAPSSSAPAQPAAAVDSDDEEDRPLSKRPGVNKKGSKRQRVAKANKGDNEEDEEEQEAEEEAWDSDAEDDAGLAVEYAKRVLQLGTLGDHEGVLSVFGTEVTRETPHEVLRKSYRGLAKMLHPDKLGRRFPAATKAFQYLTRAFDTLTAPEVADAAKGKKGKAQPSLGRSNENCYRTKITCPRCYAPWGLPDSGLQPWEYTVFMQGLKTYHCCRCLQSFGCMTAGHSCPFCKDADQTYHPDNYHKQVECTECDATYGYRLYAVGPRNEARLREEILQHQRERQKQRDAQAKRQERRAAPPLSDAQRQKQAERLFARGLADTCPRCGAKGGDDDVKNRLHLRSCTDASKIGQYQYEQQAMAGAQAHKAGRIATEEEERNLAAWKFLGAQADSAWLLTDKQLEKQCAERGVSLDGGRDDKLGRLSEALRSDEAAAGSGGGRARLTEAAVPDNLHTLSLAQLSSVCAARGIAVPPGSGTEELIELVEAHTGAHGDDAGAAQALRLCKAEDPSDTAWQGGDAAAVADDEE